MGAMEIRIVILHGAYQGREIPLPETVFVIGRDESCHLRPHCLRVSRRHCAIATWAGKVRVRDLHSRNGTYLNGHQIAGEVSVEDGDELRVGTQVFAFHIKDVKGNPVGAPIASEGEVEWLLKAPPALANLSASFATRDLALEPESSEEAERMLCDVSWLEAETASTSKPLAAGGGLSAGQQFRNYFAQRTRSS